MEIYDKAVSIQIMLDYIETHLKEEITLSQIAKASGFSPSYASRLFKSVMGISAFDYIRQRRMTEAAKVLADTHTKVVDVAFDFVFDSHEGFTRAFSKTFGLSPMEYSKEQPPIPYYLPYSIKEYHGYLAKKITPDASLDASVVFVQILKKPKRKVMIKRGYSATHYFDYCEEVGSAVWGTLMSVKNALSEPMGMWLPVNMILEGTSEYVQGVELPMDYTGPIPSGFEILTMDACQYLVFQGAPFKDDQFSFAIESFWEALKSYNPELYGFQWALDEFPVVQLEPLGYRGYIEMRPIRPLSKAML